MRQRVQDLVIGGGVIGLACARELHRLGRDVVLIEKDDVSAGASHGNAGWIAASFIAPLPAPGLPWKAIQSMFHRESPFYVRPRISLPLIQWLLAFTAHCRTSCAERGLRVLRDLHREAVASVRALVEEEALACEFQRRGVLFCYLDARSFDKACEGSARISREGYSALPLGRRAVREFEPALSNDVAGGIHYESEADLVPHLFMRGLAERLKSRGVGIRTQTPVSAFQTQGDRIAAVETPSGTLVPDHVILAAGCGTVELARRLGIRLTLEAGKGYSITFGAASSPLRHPLYLDDAKVAVTPWKETLRLSGTMELGGTGLQIDPRRIGAIVRAARAYLPRLPADGAGETWAGLRPLTPDGLPLIGRSGKYRNLFLATGHGMLGVTEAVVTARLIGNLLTGEPPFMEISALAPARWEN